VSRNSCTHFLRLEVQTIAKANQKTRQPTTNLVVPRRVHPSRLPDASPLRKSAERQFWRCYMRAVRRWACSMQVGAHKGTYDERKNQHCQQENSDELIGPLKATTIAATPDSLARQKAGSTS